MTAKTDLTVIDFDSATAVEIRKLAAEYGIKGASRGKKAELTAALAPIATHQREAKEAKELEASRKIKAPKIEAPKVRKIRFTQDELAMEENGHSDQGHEDIARGEDIAHFSPDYRAEIEAYMERCPICHPEIIANTAHSGSSRLGMVINVPVRADGKAKAETVAKRLDAVKVPAKIRRFKGVTTLLAEVDGVELKLVWDEQGRYQYNESTYKGRKVRNVSEALRLVSA